MQTQSPRNADAKPAPRTTRPGNSRPQGRPSSPAQGKRPLQRPPFNTPQRPRKPSLTQERLGTKTQNKPAPRRTNPRPAPKPRHSSRPTPAPRPPSGPRPTIAQKPGANTPPQSGAKKLRLIPLGGLEEIGSNMMVIEYGRDIVIVDCGNQFPSEDMHGIDLIIPNTKYLEGREKDIKGIVFTHGHLDHIGAVPYIVPNIGNPTLYANDITAAMIEKKSDEFKDNPKLNIQIIDKDSKVNFGQIKVEFFHVTHSFPNALGIVIKTPAGTVVMTGDFRMDLTPHPDEPLDFVRLAEISKEGVTVLLSDSTGAPKEGFALSERRVTEEMEIMFEKAKGRIIIATFSSLITRVQQIIMLAEKLGRRVVVEGYSMRTNVEIAQKLGYIHVNKKIFISAEESAKLPDDKILILSTGAQGEGNAALMRMATGEHRSLDIHKGDTVILSSSVIPGNERTVQALMDSIYRKGATILHYKMMDLHASGHGYAEDLRLMMAIMNPTFFVPAHGTYHMMKSHIKIAHDLGISPKNTRLVTNGQVTEINQTSINVLKKTIETGYVMVDGLGVGDIGNVVLRDRQMMAEDGMFTIIVVVDGKKGQVVGSPDIISRGFIYMKESKDILSEVRKKTKTIVREKIGKDHTSNFNYIKDNIRDKIGQYLFTKTQRRPMVLPVIIEV